jgi:FkbM family methyltransferase
MLGALQRFIRKGDVVYDIGANIGLYSRFIVQCFNASCVYAFEPMEQNRSLLAENLKIAGCSSRVNIVPRAIGNEDGAADFQIDDLTSNSGTLDAVAHGTASQSRAQYGLAPATVRISVARLDTLVESEGFPKPDVIKMDVEGAEALALEGAKSVLLKYQPRLVIELHSAEVAQQVLKILWSVGYRCFGYLDDGNVYGEFTPDHLKRITGLYTVHYLAASPDPSDIVEPIEKFTVSR